MDSSTLSAAEKAQHFKDACGKISGCSSVAAAVGDGCGLVSEAIVDRLDVKRAVIAEIEASCSERCLITTNTLSIPLSALHVGAVRPERVLGLRFLHPVLFIPYAELSMADSSHQQGTFEECAARTRGMMTSLGKTCFETAPLGRGQALQEGLRMRGSVCDNRLRLGGVEATRHQQREARTRTSKDPAFSLVMAQEEGCVVCLDGPCEVLNVGCGHKVMCTDCAREMAGKVRRQTCPLCRVEMFSDLTFVSGEAKGRG